MTDWKKKTVPYWGIINRISKRRFANETLAEEAALYVLESLEQDNWNRLKQYRAKSSFQTYLCSLTFRLLEDFSRKKFGRIRPPLWVQKLGGMWNLLFTFLCLERFPPHEAVEQVVVRMPSLDSDDIENAAWEIREKVTDCGTHQSQEFRFDEQTTYPEFSDTSSTVHQKLEFKERAQLFTALFHQLFSLNATEQHDPAIAAMTKIEFNLSSEERLLLKLCYRDGINRTEAGRMLGYNRYQIHGRMRRLLGRLRKIFNEAGVDEILHQMLRE